MPEQPSNQLLPPPLPFADIKDDPFPTEWNEALLVTHCHAGRVAAQIALNAAPPEGLSPHELAQQLNEAQGSRILYEFQATKSEDSLLGFIHSGLRSSGMAEKNAPNRYLPTDKGRDAAPILGVLAAHFIEQGHDLSTTLSGHHAARYVTNPSTSLALIQEISRYDAVTIDTLSAAAGIRIPVMGRQTAHLHEKGILERAGMPGPEYHTLTVPPTVKKAQAYVHPESETMVKVVRQLSQEGVATINCLELIERTLALLPGCNITVPEVWKRLYMHQPGGLKLIPRDKIGGKRFFYSIDKQAGPPYIKLIRMIHSLRDRDYRVAAANVAAAIAPQPQDGRIQPPDLLRRLLAAATTPAKVSEYLPQQGRTKSKAHPKPKQLEYVDTLPPSPNWLELYLQRKDHSEPEAGRLADVVGQLADQDLAVISSIHTPPADYPEDVLARLKAHDRIAPNGNFTFFSKTALSAFTAAELRAVAMFHGVEKVFYGDQPDLQALRSAFNLPLTPKDEDLRAMILRLAEKKFMPRFWRAKAASKY